MVKERAPRRKYKSYKSDAIIKSIDVLIDNNIISKASLVMNLSNWGLHLNQDEVEVLLGFKEGKLTTERNTINNKKSKVTKVNFKSKKR